MVVFWSEYALRCNLVHFEKCYSGILFYFLVVIMLLVIIVSVDWGNSYFMCNDLVASGWFFPPQNAQLNPQIYCYHYYISNYIGKIIQTIQTWQGLCTWSNYLKWLLGSNLSQFKQSIFVAYILSWRSIWVLLELVRRWTKHFTKIDQEKREI